MNQFEESKAEEWMDAKGGILLPGFVNAHTHCRDDSVSFIRRRLPRPSQTLPISTRTRSSR